MARTLPLERPTRRAYWFTLAEVKLDGGRNPYRSPLPAPMLSHFQPPQAPPDDSWGLDELREHDIRFYAVLRFDSGDGELSWWKSQTDGALYPMNGRAMEKLLEVGEFQNACGALVDGLWEVRKRGHYVSIWPVTAGERDADEAA